MIDKLTQVEVSRLARQQYRDEGLLEPVTGLSDRELSWWIDEMVKILHEEDRSAYHA
jgi:hypothetical protein